MAEFIIRKKYLDILIWYAETPIIKVIVWQRRSGKSVLLQQLRQHLGLKETLLLDLEEYEMKQDLQNSHQLYTYLQEHIKPNTKTILVDEIQTVESREKAILWIRKKHPTLDIYITWSNSTMLSSQLTTLLRWRYVEISVYPFSYNEFCEYFWYTYTKSSLQSFLEEWWYASSYIFATQEQKKMWIRQMIDSIMLNDIIERYSVKDIGAFREVLLYLISVSWNITNTFSINKHMNTIGYNLSLNTLQSYIRYLEDNFLVYTCDLYDMHGKKVFDRLRKYYISDHALRVHLFSAFDSGYGKLLENMVFMEAKKAGYAISTGRKWDLEVDFILEKEGQKLYLQIAYLLTSPEVISRETAVFEQIKDNRPKYVISMDEVNLWTSSQWYYHLPARQIYDLF